MLKLPRMLIQRIQYDYIDKAFKEGTYMVQGLDEKAIESVINSFVSWLDEEDKIEECKADISSILKKG